MNAASQGHNLVAFCDVLTEESDRKGGYVEAAKAWPKARRYQDWRRLLDESKDIDAITISTPDHMHAAPTLSPMRLGKHVDTQKPLTHTVHESRTLMLEARRLGVATQMGIQNQSLVGHRNARRHTWGEPDTGKQTVSHNATVPARIDEEIAQGGTIAITKKISLY